MQRSSLINPFSQPTRIKLMPKKPIAYETGYQKPPKHTQFSSEHQPARTRKRRPNQDFMKLFKRVLAETVTLTLDGQPRAMSRGQAVLMANYVRALNRDQRSMKNIFTFAEAASQWNEPAENEQVAGILAIPEPCTPAEFERRAAEANAAGAEQYRREMKKEGK
jgi:hypothetical protein